VTILNKAGLISLYLGIPYVLTISWKASVNSLFLKKVGGFE
jgi:hypothetical protein